MAKTYTYTPTDPLDAYAPTEVFGISFEVGKAVNVGDKEHADAVKRSGRKVEDIEAKLDGNPQFTKSGEGGGAIKTAKQQAKDAEAALELQRQADASRAQAPANPTA